MGHGSEPQEPAQVPAAGPAPAEPMPRAYRRWTQRLAAALGLSRRRIQKLIEDGAPDATDPEAAADFPALEQRWRVWLSSHPRWRKLGRRIKPPLALDHAAPAGAESAQKNAGSRPAGGDGRDQLSLLEGEKLAKATADRKRAELALARETGEVIPRDRALASVTDALLAIQGALEEFPARLAMELPVELRDPVRVAGRALAAKEKIRIAERLRQSWRAAIPPKEG